MSPAAIDLPRRSRLLSLLHAAHARAGYLTGGLVAAVAAEARIPVAEAWEAATSYPEFRLEPPDGRRPVCTGLSCALNGATVGAGDVAAGCLFRCHDAPAVGADRAPDETVVRRVGPLLAPDVDDFAGLDRARAMSQEEGVALVDGAGLRGRGGAYFPTGRKWRSALAERRPLALVVNAEEGEPGVFKDRVILCRRPRRFIEGLAIAARVLQPAVVVVFINGEAKAARASLEAALASAPPELDGCLIIAGGGGYVLGEESALLNAIEGRKPVPRLRPPYPVESGLFGMPTVINNVETITDLSLIFREPAAFRTSGTAEAPGTKLFSVSGRVREPGLYELPLGTTLAELVRAGGGATSGHAFAALVGGPSGGFLPAAEFDRPLLPGLVHPTGAVAGSGGVVLLDQTSDLRMALQAMADFNAAESCGKCTPCREGAPRLAEAIRAGDADLDGLLEVVGTASLCGLGQMAPGPIRSALAFWPELLR